MRSEDAGQSNICDLSSPIHSQQDVGRLEIQEHDAVGVQEVQPLGNIQSYVGPPAAPLSSNTAQSVRCAKPYADMKAFERAQTL